LELELRDRHALPWIETDKKDAEFAQPINKPWKEIQAQEYDDFHPPPSAQVEKIEKEMVSLLSAKQGKAFESIGGE
jgi:hypothetical protein